MDPSPSPDPDFEHWLAGQAPPEARQEFRDALRQAFTRADHRGSATGAGESESRDRYGERIPAHVMKSFEDLLARETTGPPADPDFRAALRERFVTGFQGEAVEPAPEGATPRTGERVLRLLVPVLAAAAVLAVALFLPDEPRWRLDDRLTGPVTFAGEAYGPSESDRLQVELSHSGWLESGDTHLVLELSEGMRLEVLPGSRLLLPNLGVLGPTADLDLQLDQGEIYVHARGKGREVRIGTPEGSVTMGATILGVAVADAETCFCVAEGLVKFRRPGAEGSPILVEAWKSLLFLSDEPPPAGPVAFPADPSANDHIHGLLAFAGL